MGMETVVIERQPGKRDTCRYLARDPKEADGNLRFYAEIKGQWRVVTLEAVRPRGGRFVNDAGDIVPSPFSDSPPKEIIACRLCPPPCCADQAEAKQQHPDDWQECLWVRPEQERRGSTLRNMLARLRQAARAARRGQDVPFFPAYESQLAASYGKRRLTAEFPFEREYCGRIEKMTVADFKQGHWQGRANFTRDAFLVAEWVKRDRVDTAQMDGDAKTCFGWMSAQNWHDHDASSLLWGCEADILEDEWEPYFQSVADKFLSAHYGKDYRTMFRYRRSVFAALLARVRYKVTFEDGKAVFLTDCRKRMPTESESTEIVNGEERSQERAATGRRYRISRDYTSVGEKIGNAWHTYAVTTPAAQLGLRMLVEGEYTPTNKCNGFKECFDLRCDKAGRRYSVDQPSQVFRHGKGKRSYPFYGRDKMIRYGGGMVWLDLNSPALTVNKKRTRGTGRK